MRFFVHCLSWLITGILFLSAPAARAESDTYYIRVVAHDDTVNCQQQKVLARDMLLSQWQAGLLDPAQLEAALRAAGFPASVSLRNWTPGAPYAAQPTLYVTLGAGKGHNWWGILCTDALEWDFLQCDAKSDAPSGVASSNIRLVFPLLERLLSFLFFRQD